ncbi:MAG: hypothetical protein AAGK78_11225, partial [Planctomycetota bacterium]
MHSPEPRSRAAAERLAPLELAMWKLWMLGVLAQAAITPEREPSGDNLQVRSAVIGGVDSNAEQSSRNQRAVTAVDVELDLLFERAIGMKTFVDVQAEVDVTWFGGEVDASRATLGAFLAFGRTLMGNAGRKKTERQYPVVEAQVGLGYGLAVRIDGRPEAPSPVWRRRPSGELPPLTDLADDDVFDPDTGITGPAIAFLRPLHDWRLSPRLRWLPRRGTRIELETAVSRVLQGGNDPGDPVRHYVQPEVEVGFRQRLWSRFRLDGEYRFEWRTHDAREDRRDNTLRLSTHRTRLGVAFRGRRWRWRLEHRFRFRSASGDGARTRRQVLRTQLQRRFGRT